MGTRKVPFGRELYIDRADFMIEPPKSISVCIRAMKFD